MNPVASAYIQAVMTAIAKDTVPCKVAKVALATIQPAQAKNVWTQDFVLQLWQKTALPHHVVLGSHAALFRTKTQSAN